MPLRAVATNENSETVKPKRTKENFLALFAEFSALRDKMRAMILVDSKDLKLAVQDKKLASKLSKQSLRAERTIDQLVAYFKHEHDGENYSLNKFDLPTTFNDEKIIKAYIEQLSAFVSMVENLLGENRDKVGAIVRADNMQQPLEGILNRMPMMKSRINRELKKAELSKREANSTSSGKSQSDHTDKEKQEAERKAKLAVRGSESVAADRREQKKQAKLKADRKKKEREVRERRKAKKAVDKKSPQSPANGTGGTPSAGKAAKEIKLKEDIVVSETDTYSLETIQALLQHVEDNQEAFRKPIRFEIVSEIIHDMFDKLEAATSEKPAENECQQLGINFDELYALFEKGVDGKDTFLAGPFKRELAKLRKELKKIGVWLKGTLHADVKEPKPILLEWIV